VQQHLQRKPDVQQHRVRVAALPYNSKNYEFGRWLNGGGSDASGTIMVAFAQITSQAYLQVALLRSFSPAIEHFNPDPASTLLMLP
jgi:hypothetical protein